MTYRWRAEIHVWPHSTGQSSAEEQRAAGPRLRSIEIVAHSIEDALKLVQLYRDGVATNPAVWQAPIFKLERVCS